MLIREGENKEEFKINVTIVTKVYNANQGDYK